MNGARWNLVGALAVVMTALVGRLDAQPTEFQVNVTTEFRQNRPDVAMDAAGRFVVVWVNNEVRGSSQGMIQARRFAVDGQALGDELRVTDPGTRNSTPSVTMHPSGESFLVLWYRYSGGLRQGAPVETEPVGSIPRHKCEPIPADAWARRFAADGTPLSDEFPVDSSPSFSRIAPVGAVHSSGEFVVAWMEYVGFLNIDIRGRRFAADAAPKGEAFTVNTHTPGFQVGPQVVMDDQGGFLVAWQDEGGVRARRFGADASPMSGEVEIQSRTDRIVDSTAVGVNAAGRFLVTWSEFESANHDTASIRGLFLDAGGIPMGPELELAAGDRRFDHDMAMAPSGDFGVVWSSEGSDGPGTEVQGRVFGTDGSARGEAFEINTYTTSRQDLPKVAMDGRGNLVAVWESLGSLDDDLSDYSVQARLPLAITVVPTLSRVGLVVLAGLMGLVAVVALRRSEAPRVE